MIVVFPAPVGPTIAMMEPGFACMLKEWMICTSGQISEGNLVQDHIALHVFRLNRSLYIGGLLFFIQQTEDTFCRRTGRLQFTNNIGGFIDRTTEFTGILDKGCDIPQTQHIQQIENRAKYSDECQRQIVDEVDSGSHEGRVIFCRIICIRTCHIDGVKFIRDDAFLCIGANWFSVP